MTIQAVAAPPPPARLEPSPPPVPGYRPPARFTRWAALPLSFFSPALYRDVACNWRGVGTLYLLLVLVLTWAPPCVQAHLNLQWASADPALDSFIRQFPSVTIRKGLVSIREREPYVIRDPQTAKPLLFVDTTGWYAERREAKEAMMKLSRSALELRDGRGAPSVRDLRWVDDFYVDRHVLAEWKGPVLRWLVPALFLFVLAGLMLWGVIRLMLYGLVGLIFASAFKAPLHYDALMRLSAVAMTPGLVLATALDMAGVRFAAMTPIVGVVTLAYLALGVRANATSGVPRGF